ncbi:hypothetical protein QC762_401640 [Podospora pseudocomata]|uniref:Uncharacterized protein n=1 Tax=Podospora pseudocomata TaxID=2093779 RepID=A0ABR0GEM5_9PEZI|nr:hypothetical protein QC762_401640 [Podospora pseudocomata]
MRRASRAPDRPGANAQDAPVLLQDLLPHASATTPYSPNIDSDHYNDPLPTPPLIPNTTSNIPTSPPNIPHNPAAPTPPVPPPTTPPQPPLTNSATPQTPVTSPISTIPNQQPSNPSSTTFTPSSPNLSTRLTKLLTRLSTLPTPPVITHLHKHLKVPTILLITLLLFIFVTLISWQAHNLDWPLARIPIPSGILLLTIVAKFTDWALAGVTDDAWERLQWGPLLQRGRGNMLTFLVMGSGFGSWWRVLFSSGVQPGEETKLMRLRRLVRTKWKWRPRFSARFWSFIRIFVWLFVQFPGLILMAMIENKDSFRPTAWADVTGGLGAFNVSAGWFQPGDPSTYRQVFGILQDPTITVTTTPIGEECSREDSCQSYILSGGTTLVQPWAFVPRQLTDNHAYVIENAPAYQIDGWETSFNHSLPYASWTDDQCRVFTSQSPLGAVDGSLQICVKNDGDDGQLLAGIRECGSNVDKTGNCTLDPAYPGWDSFPAFSSVIELYRLNVDLVTDRHTQTIIELSNQASPIKQIIAPEDFLDAFALLLCPFPTNSTQISRWCAPNAVNQQLTASLAWRIQLAYSERYFDNQLSMDMLRNLFATVLYMFNPVYRAISIDGSVPWKPNETVPGLPPENTFRGSPAIQSSYVAPATWTVVAFIVSAVVLISAAVIAMVVSSVYADMPDLNKFLVLDGMKVVVVDPATGDETFFGDVVCREKTKEGVIYMASRTTVCLASGATAGSDGNASSPASR